MKVLTISAEIHSRLRLAALREVMNTCLRIAGPGQDRELEMEGNCLDLREAVECVMALAVAGEYLELGSDGGAELGHSQGERDGAGAAGVDIGKELGPINPIALRPRCVHGVLFTEDCETCDATTQLEADTAAAAARGKAMMEGDMEGARAGLDVEPDSFAERYLQQQGIEAGT